MTDTNEPTVEVSPVEEVPADTASNEEVTDAASDAGEANAGETESVGSSDSAQDAEDVPESAADNADESNPPPAPEEEDSEAAEAASAPEESEAPPAAAEEEAEAAVEESPEEEPPVEEVAAEEEEVSPEEPPVEEVSAVEEAAEEAAAEEETAVEEPAEEEKAQSETIPSSPTAGSDAGPTPPKVDAPGQALKGQTFGGPQPVRSAEIPLIQKGLLNTAASLNTVTLAVAPPPSYSIPDVEVQHNGNTYPLAELVSAKPDNPGNFEGIMFSAKEDLIAENDYPTVFNVTKAEFEVMPKWKKIELKKKVGLF